MFYFLVILILITALRGWYWIGTRLLAHHPILIQRPSQPAPWGLLDLIFVLVLLIAISALAMQVAIATGWLPASVGTAESEETIMSPLQLIRQISLFAASSLAAWATGFAWIAWRHRTSLGEHGLHWPSTADLQLGFIAGAILMVPVYCIQALLVAIWKPSPHPLVEMLEQSPSPTFFLFAGVFAVVIAPVTEELFFRVWLQGWFENLAGSFGRPVAADHPNGVASKRPELLLIGRVRSETTDSTSVDPGLADAGGRTSIAAGEPVDGQRLELAEMPTDTPEIDRTSLWAILFSSFFFAAAHFGNGLDPVPLFFFALGLGYLYQRTRRIIPCIVVHAMCNGFSLYMLWSSLQAAD